MTPEEYGARPCVCGRPRREHAHMKDARGGLRILPITAGPVCTGYCDVLELALIPYGGRIDEGGDRVTGRSSLDPHERDCQCVSCQYAADVLVHCTACGSNEGEDCVGVEAGHVHWPRRELRLALSRQKPTLRLVTTR